MCIYIYICIEREIYKRVGFDHGTDYTATSETAAGPCPATTAIN